MNASDITSYLNGLDGPLRDIGEKIRPVIDSALPDGSGALWHGHPTWSLGAKPGQTPICLLKGYTSYVTFGLWRGQEVADPSGRLVAGARQMASVKLSRTDEVDPVLFGEWLRRAVALETK
ncbi:MULTISPECIES: DUF1801 domain-containing protein [unclassified Streptomyces]|uniref:DUF1801 domain-containing protein n=1 Tax=unclassified Streptomyces TaxID=2593676 RepID=UPI0033A5C720